MTKAATNEEAASQISTFGKLLILKLIEFYPTLKESFIEPLLPELQLKMDQAKPIQSPHTFQPSSAHGSALNVKETPRFDHTQFNQVFDDQRKAQQNFFDEQNRMQ